MLHTCPKCEKPYEVGKDWRAPCQLSMTNQAIILCGLLRNPAVKRLITTAKSGIRMARHEPSLRQQLTRSGAVTGVMHLAIQQDVAEPRRDQQ
eukprot:6630886-Alexandrium_andersonii.AAC.1